MRHGIKKIKLTKGQDSHQAAMRKMCLNFLKHGRLDTTTKRAKLVKARIDRLVHKAQKASNADRNALLKALAQKDVVENLITSIAPRYTRVSGFVSMRKLMMREGDNADMSRLSWVQADVEASAPASAPVKKSAVKAVAPEKPAKVTKSTKAKSAKAKPATKKVSKKSA